MTSATEVRPGTARAGRRAGTAAVAGLFVASLLLVPGSARAESEWKEAGIGMGAVAANIVYVPAKVLYATGGSLVAGLAFLFSAGDQDVFGPILNASLRGDYLVTPSHIRGDDPITFIGRAPRKAVATGPYGERRIEEEPSPWGAEGDEGF